MLWTQRENDPDTNAARENLGTPDRRLIKERLTRDLQHANPPRHPGQVTQQVIAGLHPLHGDPPFLAETRHIAAVVQELLPRSDGEPEFDPSEPFSS